MMRFQSYIFILLIGCNIQPSKTVSLPPIFTDNMVLQRNAEVQFWGTASPESEISIYLPWGKFSGTSNATGSWNMSISMPDSGQPFTLKVCDVSSCQYINNVVLGEVWLASGQSNMQMPLEGWPPEELIENADREIKNAANYDIRFFNVERNINVNPQLIAEGSWEDSKTSYVGEFSATAYFFAKKIHKELGVPVGIIHSSWGGTPVESWIANDALQKTNLFKNFFSELPSLNQDIIAFEQWLEPLDHFSAPSLFPSSNLIETELEKWKRLPFNDQDFIKLDFDDSNWNELELPGDYNDVFKNQITSDFDGAAILRKTFNIEKLSDDYSLQLGVVDDMELSYINGTFVGGTLGANSFKEKNYSIPKGILKQGKNVMAMRVIDTQGSAIIGSPILLKSNENSLSLSGVWKVFPTAELYERKFYRLGEDISYTEKRPNLKRLSPYSPTVLYNGMIHPLIPYTISGAIWYQGEANVGLEDEYEKSFAAMIKNWRKNWGYEFPFYFVQIAPFDYKNNLSPALRNAQRKSSSIPHTGMVVTLDIGNPANIHPAQKEQVGNRLADLALGKTYNLEDKHYASKPISIKRNRNSLVVEFDCSNDKLSMLKSTPAQLEISEDGMHFYPATAVVDNCRVIVSSSKVSHPKHVRHAWSDTATGVIVNSKNIPISTFHLSLEE